MSACHLGRPRHGNYESAGKQKATKTRKGNGWLHGALVEAALGDACAKGEALARRYRCVMRYRGQRKAVAAANAVLITAYHLLSRRTAYHARRAGQALGGQGYRVTLERVA